MIPLLWTALLATLDPTISPCGTNAPVVELRSKNLARCMDYKQTCYLAMNPGGRSNQDMSWTCYDRPVQAVPPHEKAHPLPTFVDFD